MSWDGKTYVLDVMRDERCPMAPHPELNALREQPIQKVRGRLPNGAEQSMWLLTRYDDVRAFLAHPDTSNSAADLVGGVPPGFFSFADPPDHTRLRRMLTPSFTARHIENLRPQVERIVKEALAEVELAPGTVDLVDAFAAPVPSRVISELLAVPISARADFESRSFELIRGEPARQPAVLAAMNAFMGEHIRHLRSHPGEDLLSELIRDHSAEVSDEEMIGIGNLLLIAGHATTMSALSSGMLLLLQHPAQAQRLREEPVAVPGAVEEILRYVTVESGGKPRRVTRDMTIGGQELRAGDVVRVVLPTANRDTGHLPDPDMFDSFREPFRHMAFGHGIHRCLGAPLARLEMEVAFTEFLRLWPRPRLAVPQESLQFDNAAVRSLPVLMQV